MDCAAAGRARGPRNVASDSYKEQWTRLLAMADEIREFIKEHDAELRARPES
jgi:hypothetical protein